MVQRWFFLHTGNVCTSHTIHGFKEIRYYSPDILDFILEAFPKAKFIINYHLDIRMQSKSSFYSKNETSEVLLQQKTKSLLDWSNIHPKETYQLPLQHFTPTNFTSLFRWLGFSHCKAVSVVHANDHTVGGYQHTPGDVKIGEAISCSE
jgi:hypothetical protein